MLKIVYFSNVSENTHRFVEKLGIESMRIPVLAQEGPLVLPEDFGSFILITPTYENKRRTNFVPRQVVKFLNEVGNRENMVGVIAAGNINFGPDYAVAGDIIAKKCGVPYLYSFELLGTKEDVENVQTIIQTQSQ